MENNTTLIVRMWGGGGKWESAGVGIAGVQDIAYLSLEPQSMQILGTARL